ncbi:hypothetical protein L596_021012 [Steinernema carpocapsae]|uniref:Uncharacterized protein n=1 Tax=Steinernema carpocapsae TaxID=34508 RepID=A0A4U5MVF8_STECR|nr:hypothetical protein L596_021012 [Steinernema carpocapsae]
MAATPVRVQTVACARGSSRVWFGQTYLLQSLAEQFKPMRDQGEVLHCSLSPAMNFISFRRLSSNLITPVFLLFLINSYQSSTPCFHISSPVPLKRTRCHSNEHQFSNVQHQTFL